MIKTFLFIVFASMLFSCKTSKENFSSQSNKQAEQSSTSVINQALDSTIFLTFQKTSCFGTCPVFKLTIYQNGKALYNGKQNVAQIGDFTTTFSNEELNEIKQKANEIHFFDLEKEYNTPATDFPSTYTYLNFDGKEKLIKDRQAGPSELKDFEKYIQNLINSKELIKQTGRKE